MIGGGACRSASSGSRARSSSTREVSDDVVIEEAPAPEDELATPPEGEEQPVAPEAEAPQPEAEEEAQPAAEVAPEAPQEEIVPDEAPSEGPTEEPRRRSPRRGSAVHAGLTRVRRFHRRDRAGKLETLAAFERLGRRRSRRIE